jgi:flagellar FliJ protein
MSSKRLQVVKRVSDAHERQHAEALAASERRVIESEAKLAELEAYQANYTGEFRKRAALGIVGAGLRDFQAFLARLGEAVRLQAEIVARAHAERDAERSGWQSAAQRAEIVGNAVKRRQQEEQRVLERREQHETDERAQRPGGRSIDASNGS